MKRLNFLKFFNLKSKNFYRYPFAIGAIFRNEAPYLKEWIEFHKLIGVERFYLFNHYSQDNYQEVLEPYIARGEVQLIQWTLVDNSWRGFCFNVQPKAYTACLQLAKNDRVKWLALIDIDEFLTPYVANHVMDVLKDYDLDNIGGVCFNYQTFGTAGLTQLPTDQLMIEALNRKAGSDSAMCRYFKSIVRPERVFSCKNPHFMHYKRGFHAVKATKELFDSAAFDPAIDLTGPHLYPLMINHYWTRAEDFCYATKFPKYQIKDPQFNKQTMQKMINQFNQVPDESMQRFFIPLRERLGLSIKD